MSDSSATPAKAKCINMLLQEEEEELSGFMHGGDAGGGMRGGCAKGPLGSDSDGPELLEQAWPDMQARPMGTQSLCEDLASDGSGGAGRLGRQAQGLCDRMPLSRNRLPLSHLGSSDSLNRIMSAEVRLTRVRLCLQVTK